MELNCIRQLYDYNRWADRRILAIASRLTNEDLSAQWATAFHQFATLSRTFWARNGSGWNDGKDGHQKLCLTGRAFPQCSH